MAILNMVYYKADSGGWTPGINTIAYFPFETDQLDHSGNGHSFNKTLTQETIGYSTTQSNGNITATNSTYIKFVGCWYNVNSISTTNLAVGLFGTTNLGGTVYYAGSGNASYRNRIITFQGSGYTAVGNTEGMNYGNWHYLARSLYDGVFYICKDGVVTVQYNGTPYIYGDNNIGLTQIQSGANFKATFSQYIIEDTGWKPQYMTDYYNQTKSNYGY